ncbi:hypothetical protein [Nereida sp.]|uniref:hypothetical protein n=1 Tax=Nereida sp. TaxID=2736090 RepID=UPI003F699A5B
MVLTFLLGIGCGLAVPRVEQPLRTAIEKISLIKLKLEPAEMDVVSVLVLMIGASLICGLLDISSSAFLLALGTLIGRYGQRIIAGFQSGE